MLSYADGIDHCGPPGPQDPPPPLNYPGPHPGESAGYHGEQHGLDVSVELPEFVFIDVNDHLANHLKKPHVVGQSVSKGKLDAADMEALQMMWKGWTEEGLVNWRCSICQFTSRDKTRMRKHVKTHIKTKDSKQALFHNTSVNKVVMDEEDQAALWFIVKIKTEKGVNEWQCTVCQKQNKDKTKIRNHIKRMHVFLITEWARWGPLVTPRCSGQSKTTEIQMRVWRPGRLSSSI